MKRSFPRKIKWKPTPLAFFAIGIAACTLSLGSLLIRKEITEERCARLTSLHKKRERILSQLVEEKKVLAQIKKASPSYLKDEVESIPVMEKEIKKLRALLKANPNQAAYKNRLTHLACGENSLTFEKKGEKQVGSLKETTLCLKSPVEMGKEDLLRLLAAVEGAPLSESLPSSTPPQLVIKHLELTKNSLSPSEESYLVHLELIQREALP